MVFRNNYANLIAGKPEAHTRLIRDYDGSKKDFDFIIIGSGVGGGILADDLADRHGSKRRILVLDVGSFVYPTHVYNFSRFPNYTIASHFGVDNFWQNSSETHHIGEKPQMVFGGRSIFWSGLIPRLQKWELDFFPEPVRKSLDAEYIELAAKRMNASRSLGDKAVDLVKHFATSPLNDDFVVRQTSRALHQPYLRPDGTPQNRFFTEPTGVFNTAELLINQVGITNPKVNLDGNGLFIKLNTFVETILDAQNGWHEVKTTSTINGQQESFYAPKVIIAAGSIESPKLICRSAIYRQMPTEVKQLVGCGLTDHPVTNESRAYISSLGDIPITCNDHAKITFYSRGIKDECGRIKYPFNIEMNVNHEYWHLRDNDPDELITDGEKMPRVDIKFSFANCLDDSNAVLSRADDGYTPEIRFKRFSHLSDLLGSRFPAVAGWNYDLPSFIDFLNITRDRVFREFGGVQYTTPAYGTGQDQLWPFGYGTVHHACGTLRMPWKPALHTDFNHESVVDEDLQVRGGPGLYVCDMSVMPISTAANPVRALAGLALRLSRHLA